jgi:hypothetical protein
MRTIAPGSSAPYADPSDLVVFEDSMYFAAFTEESGREGWRKNGTYPTM